MQSAPQLPDFTELGPIATFVLALIWSFIWYTLKLIDRLRDRD